MQVGDLEVLPVADGRLLAPWPDTYPEGPEVADHRFATDDGRIILSVGGFLVRSGDLGVAPADVTDVVLTHLHFDHIGWASVGGAPFFPDATYRCARPDVEYFLGADGLDETFFGLVFGATSAAERLAPVLDRLEPWDGDATLAPGIDGLLAPGHTPGSAVVVVSSGEHRALLLGDIVHCPLELTDDEFVFLGDVDPDLARRTRDHYRRVMEDGDIAAAGAHFTDLQFGRLLPGRGRRGWQIES